MSDRGLRTEAPGVALSCRPWRTPRQRTYGRSSRPASGFRSGQTILSISWPPHGLEDLFALRVRHNPVRASAATYRQRGAETVCAALAPGGGDSCGGIASDVPIGGKPVCALTGCLPTREVFRRCGPACRFNPRVYATARRLTMCWFPKPSSCFNPRAHAGRDGIDILITNPELVFQPTRPRGARRRLYNPAPFLHISVNARELAQRTGPSHGNAPTLPKNPLAHQSLTSLRTSPGRRQLLPVRAG